MSLLQDYSNMLVSNFAFSSVFTFFFFSNESLLIKKIKKRIPHRRCTSVVVHQSLKLQYYSNISNKLEQGRELKAILQSNRESEEII